MSSETQPEDALVFSPRGNVLNLAKQLWLSIRSNSYKFVHRGPVNWATFPFEQYPRAVAILCDEADIFATSEQAGTTNMLMAFEIFAKLPEDISKELDDHLLDEFFLDTQKVLRDMISAKDPSDTPIVMRIPKNGARAVETHDANLGVQGLIVNIRLDY